MNVDCGNWDCGRTIHFLGIIVSNFWYWFFAVRALSSLSISNEKKISQRLTVMCEIQHYSIAPSFVADLVLLRVATIMSILV
jgi:hypothetical protein